MCKTAIKYVLVISILVVISHCITFSQGLYDCAEQFDFRQYENLTMNIFTTHGEKIQGQYKYSKMDTLLLKVSANLQTPVLRNLLLQDIDSIKVSNPRGYKKNDLRDNMFLIGASTGVIVGTIIELERINYDFDYTDNMKPERILYSTIIGASIGYVSSLLISRDEIKSKSKTLSCDNIKR